jgi:predicted DNA-binding transcriptional regulator AlpA
MSLSHLLTEDEAASVFGVARGTLRNWRHLKRGPAYIKIGRAVRYAMADLEAFFKRGKIYARP